MSGFGEHTTADEVLDGVDLSGKRVFITGASAGLGIETARVLAARGARVTGAARNLAKAREASKPVVEQAGNGGGLQLVELDLASLASVRACADALIAASEPFDVIIANAGVMACPFGRTEDGFETQFGTNHLGHFVLVNRLASLLGSGGRFISLSSVGHRLSDIDLEDPNYENTPYSAMMAYGRSKTANALFAIEFDRRHRALGVRGVAIHPGAILETELQRHMTPEIIEDSRKRAATSGAGGVTYKTIPEGAATTVWSGFVATAEEVGGKYCEDCHVAPVNDDEAPFSGARSYLYDKANAAALWAKSEEMVGERF